MQRRRSRAPSEATIAGLTHFDRVFEVHVRDEERELFPVAAAILPTAALAEVVT
jgi:hypothetical protein